jgi:hypothetical protein
LLYHIQIILSNIIRIRFYTYYTIFHVLHALTKAVKIYPRGVNLVWVKRISDYLTVSKPIVRKTTIKFKLLEFFVYMSTIQYTYEYQPEK